MPNHYHLALETPEGNLVEGMRWLQSTFANRFRGESGHVFQGRHKALLVEDSDGLGAAAHYIHLNPVRAKLLPVERLTEYADSMALLHPKRRPACLDVKAFLQVAGDLVDSPAGRRKYGQYLAWLAENEPAQKQLKFETMSKGWAMGSKAFKQALVEDHKELLADPTRSDSSVREAKELIWKAALKAAPWKVAIAGHLKSVNTVSNVWLAQHLHMGAPDEVSRYVSELRRGQRKETERHAARITNIRV